MKKLIVFALVMILILPIFTACGDNSIGTEGNNDDINTPSGNNTQSDDIQGSWKAIYVTNMDGEKTFEAPTLQLNPFSGNTKNIVFLSTYEPIEPEEFISTLFGVVFYSTWSFNDDNSFNILFDSDYIDFLNGKLSQSEYDELLSNIFPMCNGTWEKLGVSPFGGTIYKLTTFAPIWGEEYNPLELTVKDNAMSASIMFVDEGKLYFERTK